jgi:hypothetical protein
MAITEYEALAGQVEQALRHRFPNAENIMTEPSYQERIHARGVSREFNGLTEREKQDLLWKMLREELGAESARISLGLAYGTDEFYDPEGF